MSVLKKILIGVAGLVGLVLLGGGIFVWTQVSAFNASMAKVYDVPVPKVERSSDPAVLARGKHLAESVTPCSAGDCHGPDLSGGKTLAMGPIGTFTGPNVSAAGMLAVYSDGELARLIRHGIKKDGTSARFMPAQDWSWLPDSEIAAVISYLRTLPAVQKENGPLEIGVLGKVLDRQEVIPIDVARHIDHSKIGYGPAPSPTAEYGSYLAKLCTGCHGATFSGGRIPGAPPDMPTPTNLTPHATGTAGWTYEDFDRVLVQGIKKDGKKVDPMMPIEAFGKFDETEKRALFAYLQSLPPKEFGNR